MISNDGAVGTVRLVAVAILVVTVSTQPLFLLATGAPQIGRDLGFGPAVEIEHEDTVVVEGLVRPQERRSHAA